MSEPTYLPFDTWRGIFACVNETHSGIRNLFAFYLMLFGGLRVGEVVALEVNDVEETDEGWEIHVPNETKTGWRTVYVPDLPEFREAREDYLAIRAEWNPSSDALFVAKPTKRNPTTRRLARQELSAALDVVVERAKNRGIIPRNQRVHPHAMRHSYATTMVSKVPLHILQKQLGHKSLRSTAKYLHASDPERAKVIGGVKL